MTGADTQFRPLHWLNRGSIAVLTLMWLAMSLTRKTEPKIWQITYLLNRALLCCLRGEVERHFCPERTPRVLDVGCGTMPYRELFAGRCGEYVGCDFYPMNESVVQCPADDLRFEDQSFDAVVSFQVLEHVRKPWAVLKECARVLKREGFLLVTAPFMFPHHSSPHDFFRFTHEGLTSMAEEAGLKVERISAQCSSLTTLLLLLNWYLMRPIQGCRRFVITRPLALILTGFLVVPINVLGLLCECSFLRRGFQKGNEGYSNYLMLCRKA